MLPPYFVFSRNIFDFNFKIAICCHRNFKNSLFHWKLKGLVPFFSQKWLEGY